MERLVDKFNKERKEIRNGSWMIRLECLMRELFVHKGREVCNFYFGDHISDIFSLSDEIYMPSNLHEQVIKFIKENGFVVSQKEAYGFIEAYLVCLS